MERSELLDAVLESMPDGLIVMRADGAVSVWNRAAEAITGFPAIDMIGRTTQENLEPFWDEETVTVPVGGRWRPLHLRHKLGHEIRAIALNLTLRDGLGGRIGRAVFFHPARSLEALPHGEGEGNCSEAANQQEFEERLGQEFADYQHGGESFGVLWVTVDQAHALRKTHGARACEEMLSKVRHAMAQGLRPAEEIARWGADEFLILAHEASAEMLALHAQTLAGLARTADFRWWGDRVQITASIGLAQAAPEEAETLADLLKRAQKAMETSVHEGGNCITPTPGGKTCLPS